jgi:hypothetical protein
VTMKRLKSASKLAAHEQDDGDVPDADGHGISLMLRVNSAAYEVEVVHPKDLEIHANYLEDDVSFMCCGEQSTNGTLSVLYILYPPRKNPFLFANYGCAGN